MGAPKKITSLDGAVVNIDENLIFMLRRLYLIYSGNLLVK